ncbi:MAG: major capsid protein [Arizlama microvirus]|nr:MAG: major capsid protein [Arizlama microvirus]
MKSVQGSDNPFQSVGSVSPGRSVFDLSYDHKTMFDMGQLIPIMCDEMVPGDHFDIGNEVVVRFQPMVAPILHEVNAFIHYFFVPYRLLWSDWEKFITGGADGAFAGTLPRWTPTNTAVGSLWDYLGFPTGINPAGILPMDFVRSSYNFIYNNYYRDENLITEVALTNESILLRAWEKDYFTSALPWQQRGTAPALPVSGSAVWQASTFPAANRVNNLNSSGSADNQIGNSLANAAVASNILGAFNANTLNTTTFNISDLRTAFQIQRWMERNARSGARYTEFLNAHFGVSPKDERLQRPEFIGGSRSPIIVSEVLKTGSTDATSPQGNMAGHGITVDQNYVAKYHALEYGLVMGIMSVMPRTAYSQGINRQWTRNTKYDFYSPEFANLSEQAILRGELYATATLSENQTIFGYQGRYDEMRYKPNKYSGKMRTTFNYWHLGRVFSGAPLLNQSFIECVPRKDIFVATTEPSLIVSVGNKIRASRPLPVTAEPGLIDHD